MSPDEERRPPAEETGEAAALQTGQVDPSVGLPVLFGYLRVPCRVKGCRETIPLSPGYLPDRTCWKHDRLIAPALEVAA
ncbi:MAG TPA: hypothetical protein VI011_17810 [Asanoa sp.]